MGLNRKDISLLDLVIVMLCVLVVVVISAHYVEALESPQQADARRARDGLMIIESAVGGYGTDRGVGPPSSAAGGLQVLVEAGYLPGIPVDPWGQPYQYQYPGAYDIMDIWSRGPDRVDSEDDIVSWDRYGNLVRDLGVK
ncbi:hypothetical protein DV711_16815 [Motiliproteus coralliicola]|uniref:Type II secretion system protein GspG C-terminal domain-containing protein n=1 Tax=Motiliproteus coralliicola TaxID=2283196 RepID=A0A369WAK4_9GAMM|nr:type II secretion system protein GspG [Motiliproteus coralliicola]RDE18321.1 hypothetical protein DV711_16815 [Motiliproteus coralliicola]